MRCLTLMGCFLATAVVAADGGATPAPKPKQLTDAGTLDAGAAAAANPLAWKAKPIFVLAEDEAAIDRYVLARPEARAAVKGMLQKVTVGTRTAAAILVEGYELPFSRRADLSADVVITDPTGREVLDKASIAVARTMDPLSMVLVPLKPVFGLMYGLTDPIGEYKIHVTIWDHVRGTSAQVEQKFLVTR